LKASKAHREIMAYEKKLDFCLVVSYGAIGLRRHLLRSYRPEEASSFYTHFTPTGFKSTKSSQYFFKLADEKVFSKTRILLVYSSNLLME